MSRKLLVCLLLLAGSLLAQSVPAGTALPIMLNSTLSVKSKEGQKIEGKLMQDVVVPEGTLKSGAHVIGKVVAVMKSSSGSSITVMFNQIEDHGANVPLSAYVRAIGMMTTVEEAQQPTNSMSSDIPQSQWYTRQIGGEMVSRPAGSLVDGKNVVGSWSGGAVLGKLRPNTELGCEESDAQQRALWLFSTTACGVYGSKDVELTDQGKKSGNVVLSSSKDVLVRGGSALLLIAK